MQKVLSADNHLKSSCLSFNERMIKNEFVFMECRHLEPYTRHPKSRRMETTCMCCIAATTRALDKHLSHVLFIMNEISKCFRNSTASYKLSWWTV